MHFNKVFLIEEAIPNMFIVQPLITDINLQTQVLKEYPTRLSLTTLMCLIGSSLIAVRVGYMYDIFIIQR